jgi:hypothetical protein
MGKRDDLIVQYADDLKNKCGMTPDMDLLTKVTIGCGPAIYNADASTVAGSQPAELETVIHRVLEHPTFDGLTSDRRTIQLTA